MPFVGPHTAYTQARAASLASICNGTLEASRVMAEIVARDVLAGTDPMPDAMIYSACERDFAWEIADLTRSYRDSVTS